MKRRQLIKTLSTLPAIGLASQVVWAKDSKKPAPAKAKAGGKPKNLASETKGLSGAMKYVSDVSRAPAMRVDKKAFCDNCAKYNVCHDNDKKKGCKPEADANAPYAPCSMFEGSSVAKKGWCMTWSAKA